MMEGEHPLTFVNRDPTAGRGLIAPRTPCPVLYGIRGATTECVEQAHYWMQSRSDVEQSTRWAVHQPDVTEINHVDHARPPSDRPRSIWILVIWQHILTG